MKMDDYYKQNDGMFWQECNSEDDYYIWRYENNPLINLKKTKYWHICNSAVVKKGDKYVAMFRVETKDGKPDLVYGESDDGVNFDIIEGQLEFKYADGTPFEYEYAYDPRLMKMGDEYYTIFCADIYGPCIYIGKSKDLKHFTIFENGFLPGNRNGAMFFEKINGKYAMLNRPTNVGQIPMGGDIWISYSDDLVFWGNHKLVTKHRDAGHNFWEAVKIGAGPAPIKTEEGWLLIYHGVQKTCNGWTYSMGCMLLDLNDPSKVLYKAKEYLLTPEETYERVGFTTNTIFPTTALCDSEGHITIYYGVADTNMAMAFTTVERLLEFVKAKA